MLLDVQIPSCRAHHHCMYSESARSLKHVASRKIPSVHLVVPFELVLLAGTSKGGVVMSSTGAEMLARPMVSVVLAVFQVGCSVGRAPVGCCLELAAVTFAVLEASCEFVNRFGALDMDVGVIRAGRLYLEDDAR